MVGHQGLPAALHGDIIIVLLQLADAILKTTVQQEHHSSCQNILRQHVALQSCSFHETSFIPTHLQNISLIQLAPMRAEDMTRI